MIATEIIREINTHIEDAVNMKYSGILIFYEEIMSVVPKFAGTTTYTLVTTEVMNLIGNKNLQD